MFAVGRSTKLVDGSRGGQAFICNLLRPEDDHPYSIEEQARVQFLSGLIVAVALIDVEDHKNWKRILEEEFQIDERLGSVFQRL
jgi:hypothetical protein